jgi:hypothetical protein
MRRPLGPSSSWSLTPGPPALPDSEPTPLSACSSSANGVNRYRYRGLHGMERWLGFGVIPSNYWHSNEPEGAARLVAREDD